MSNYIRARWLDAMKGRWDSWDPIGIVQWQAGEHPYGYAWNNPVASTDPTGLYPATCCTLRCQVTSEPVLLGNLEASGGCYSVWQGLSKRCNWVNIDEFCAIFDDGKCREAARKYGADPAIVCAAALTERSWEFIGIVAYFETSVNWLKGSVGVAKSIGCLEFRPRTAMSITSCLAKINPTMLITLGAPNTLGGMKTWLQDCAHEYELLAAWAWLAEQGYNSSCSRYSGSGEVFWVQYNHKRPLWRERYRCAYAALTDNLLV